MVILTVTLARALRAAGETGLGIVLALVPLALWVAWSPAVLLAILVAGGVSAALLVVLSWLEDAPADEARMPQDDAGRVAVPDAFVEELHRLFPLVYHHSRREKRGFRRVMDKLRRLMR